MAEGPTNPPPTIHVLIDHPDARTSHWTWEVIDSMVLCDDGYASTYDLACDKATDVIRDHLDPRATIAYHHTFRALLGVEDPRPVSWVMPKVGA